jgi:hypothetical protein
MSPMSEKDFQDYVRQANWFMRNLIEENRKAFQLDSFHRFDWNPWRGELLFSSGGTPKVVAKIQVAGTLSTKSNAWTWSWADSNLPAAVTAAARKAREYGNEQAVIALITPKWAAKESDAWEMTAVTTKLIDAKGAYKCPGKDGATYLVITGIQAVSDRKRIFGAQTCTHVLNDDSPILLVSREKSGDVLALCGSENDTPEAMRDVPLDRLLDLDPTLNLLADMPDGWAAQRETADDDWARVQAE